MSVNHLQIYQFLTIPNWSSSPYRIQVNFPSSFDTGNSSAGPSHLPLVALSPIIHPRIREFRTGLSSARKGRPPPWGVRASISISLSTIPRIVSPCHLNRIGGQVTWTLSNLLQKEAGREDARNWENIKRESQYVSISYFSPFGVCQYFMSVCPHSATRGSLYNNLWGSHGVVWL